MIDSRNRFTGDLRGVSDAVGYILLLGVVFISIASVTFLAGPVISDQQESEYTSNTVRAFEVFGENLRTIERERSPSRATEMRYKGGTLFEQDSLFMRVNVTQNGVKNTYILAGTPVTYRKGGSAVHYEMGAVVREDNGEAVMRTEPPFTFSDEQTRMSVITTTVTTEKLTLDRTGKVVILAREAGTKTRAFVQEDDPDDVEVNITLVSPRYEMWGEYFEGKGATVDSVDAANNEIRVSFTTKEFMLRETLIRVEARE